MKLRAVQLDLYRTRLAMRSFEHAAASRRFAEAVVVRMVFSDGRTGWGETLPRKYVTGETLETVIRDLSEVYWPICRDGLAGAAEDISAGFPYRASDGRCITAAACAADLASLCRLFEPSTGKAGRALMETAGRAAPRKHIDVRVSGVLGSADPAKTAKRLRLMRWYGLRDFKLKLGLGEDIDEENLRVVRRQIGRAIVRGKCTLRVDVNGGWDADSTPERAERLKRLGVCVIEQPVFCSPVELLALARKCPLPLMADESLRTEDDARFLLQEPARLWWNIRLSKNGGFVQSLFLARLAAEHRIPFTLGCMVGESSILSAAQRLLLQWGPVPRFVEGNYGRFLLAEDLVCKSLRFGYGGRLRPLEMKTFDFGVDEEKIRSRGERDRTLRA